MWYCSESRKSGMQNREPFGPRFPGSRFPSPYSPGAHK